MKMLTKKESTILKARKSGLTFKEIGLTMGFTGERARQIELMALRKLRNGFTIEA